MIIYFVGWKLVIPKEQKKIAFGMLVIKNYYYCSQKGRESKITGFLQLKTSRSS